MINYPKQRSKLIYQHQWKHQHAIKTEQCITAYNSCHPTIRI